MDFNIMNDRKIIDVSKPIMVSYESNTKLTDYDEVSDDGRILEVTLQRAEMSRNRNMYPFEDLVRSLAESKRVQESIENNVWFSECEHPFSEFSKDGRVSLKRLFRIEPSRIVGRIDRYWTDGDDIKAVYQFAGPFGNMYRDMVMNHNSNLAFSLRCYTPNYIEKTDEHGQGYVIKKYPMYPITYDLVTNPGHVTARNIDPELFKQNNHNVTVESCENGFCNFSFHNPIDEIRDILQSEESANFISDVYGLNFDKANMILTDDGYISVKTSEESSIDIPMNALLLDKIMR